MYSIVVKIFTNSPIFGPQNFPIFVCCVCLAAFATALLELVFPPTAKQHATARGLQHLGDKSGETRVTNVAMM